MHFQDLACRGILGNLGEIELVGALVPEDQLRAAVAVEVAEHQVVVLLAAEILDDVASPGLLRVEVRSGVLPPPDEVVLPVAREDDVEVAVAVDVQRIGAGLDVQGLVLDHVLRPTRGCPAIPDQGRGLRPLGDDEVVDAVLVDVAHEAGRLLISRVRGGQVAVGGGQVFPSDLAGRRNAAETKRDDGDCNAVDATSHTGTSEYVTF